MRHSLSPVIFNAAYRALDLDRVFVAFEVPDGGADAALAAVRTLDLDLVSVTMPHKTAVARAVDELSDEARVLDAVNCIVTRQGRLWGYNTDGAGFLAALAAETGFDPAGRRCAVAGAGGAARAVVLALGAAGAAEVVVVNRTPARAVAAAALGGPGGRAGSEADLPSADLVVNATPAGMADQRAIPFDPALLRPGQVVADLVYHPAETPLLGAARAAGLVAVNGLGMLVHQAAVQFHLATGLDAPVEVMYAAAVHALDTRA